MFLLSSFLFFFCYFLNRNNLSPFSLGLSSDLSRRSQYECGFHPLEEEIGLETRERFFLNFFIIALLFLIFDIETFLAYPLGFILSVLPYSSCCLAFFLNDWLFFFYSSPLFVPYLVFFFFVFILIVGVFYESNKFSLS